MHNFIPLTLFIQFMKVGNAYWLCILILRLLPAYSTPSWNSTLAFLMFVVAVGMLKEWLGDMKRNQ